jgi:hypothetical protein
MVFVLIKESAWCRRRWCQSHIAFVTKDGCDGFTNFTRPLRATDPDCCPVGRLVQRVRASSYAGGGDRFAEVTHLLVMTIPQFLS